jgi:flagellar hook-basal body complex protein FliE
MKIEGLTSAVSKVKLSPELQKLAKAESSSESSSDFGKTLMNKIQEVDQMQKTAEVATQDLATGKSRNLHEAVLAMEMADTSLRLMVTVRNKALEAYQEIMRMPI